MESILCAFFYVIYNMDYSLATQEALRYLWIEMAPPSASEITTVVRVYLANPHRSRECFACVPGRLSQFQAVSRAPATAVSPVLQNCCRCPIRHQVSGRMSLPLDGPSAACQYFPELRRGELGRMAGTKFPTTPSHPFGCCPCPPLRQCLCFLSGYSGRSTPREVYAKERCLLGRFRGSCHGPKGTWATLP